MSPPLIEWDTWPEDLKRGCADRKTGWYSETRTKLWVVLGRIDRSNEIPSQE
ncbi:hypothetical protein PISMIDRAFT_672875 [Pisolithus microcarpus 441]|uniref:Unplaced genomic scaffold scaffold_7, whole genome shotgun sequence n=1 Tax=Pisolithus microcarpus 441 TaxID=765257 RepID=A0A0C9ZRK9_9AGAM|nr:hypothetical protein PISMIDRAFT_672875 [Pisolithus microcarpus 441]